jgi:hypothetical protein
MYTYILYIYTCIYMYMYIYMGMYQYISRPIIAIVRKINVHKPAISGNHPGTRILTHSFSTARATQGQLMLQRQRQHLVPPWGWIP